jgi:hypothetical protein
MKENRGYLVGSADPKTHDASRPFSLRNFRVRFGSLIFSCMPMSVSGSSHILWENKRFTRPRIVSKSASEISRKKILSFSSDSNDRH